MQVMEAVVTKHVHRVYIVDDAEAELPTPLAIISTSDLVQLIANNLDA